MEKTPIDRLFDYNPLTKEDIEKSNKLINELVNIVSLQQKTIIEIKTLLESTIKKTDSHEQLMYSISKRLEDFINMFGNVNNVISGINQSQYQQHYNSIPQQVNNIPIQQPRPSTGMSSRLNFDPMSVSVPNPEGTTQPMTQQQVAQQRQATLRQFARK